MIKPAPEPGDKDRDLRIDGNALIGAIARSLADGAAASSARALGNELAAVRHKLAALEGELQETREALEAERTRAATIQERLLAAEQTSEQLHAQTTDGVFRITELEQLLAAAERAREELEARNTDGVFRIGELEQQLAAAEKIGADLQSRDTDRVYRIGELEQLLASADQARSELQALEADHVARIEGLEQLLATTERTCEDLQSQDTDRVYRIGELEQLLASADRARVELQVAVADLERGRAELESHNSQHVARLARLERTLAVERQIQGELESRSAAQAARLTDVEAEAALHSLDARRSREALNASSVALENEKSANRELAKLAESSRARVDELERAVAAAEEINTQLTLDLERLGTEHSETAGLLYEMRSHAIEVHETAMASLAKADYEIGALEEAWLSLYGELEDARQQLQDRDAVMVDQASSLTRSEERLRSAEHELFELRSALAAATDDSDSVEDLQALLDSAARESEEARRDAATLRLNVALARDEVVRAREHADSLAAQLATAEVQCAQFQSKIAHTEELETELDAIRSAWLADKAVIHDYATEVRERSERHLAEVRSALNEAVQREGETRERLTEQLRAAEGRLNDEIRDLRERVQDAEHTLAAQTDSVIAGMQAESAMISKLVDTVQSSRFWKLKRWLNRLRGRALGT